MRICFVGNAGSVHVKRWAKYFVDRGYEVHVISHIKHKVDGTYVDKLTNGIAGATVHELATISKLNFLMGPLQTRGLIKKIKPDIVHAHQVTPYGFYAACSGFHPLVVSALGDDISTNPEKSEILRLMCKFVLKKADLLHTGDARGEKRLIELGADKRRVFIQPWGVDTSRFSPNARKRALVATGTYSVINMRYLTDRNYNVDIFIKALPHVLKIMGNVKFIIGGSGKLEPELRKLSDELGVKEKVIFLGGISHEKAPEHIASADVYVDTAIRAKKKGGGGIGVGLMEAMACGTPQVAAKSDEILDLGEKFGGLLFEPQNPKDLAEKIIYLLRNKKIREDLGKRGRKLALEIGSWDKNLMEFEGEYERLIEIGD